jgi:hypothetical protein
MKRFYLFLFLSMVFRVPSLYAQLSEGGVPRDVKPFKSAHIQEVMMPVVSNDLLRWENVRNNDDSAILKPLIFAHTFPVHISPLTHGIWSRSTDGWWVWKVTLTSLGAYSINLMFDDIRLPDKARLFLYSPDQAHVIGAFTARTIKGPDLFATEPVEGESVVVQFELPYLPGNVADFVISAVNHDFLGILKYTDTRRPMGIAAGACNPDIRCKAGDKWDNAANSVCRVMVLGRELCTGTLLNNTAQDKRPYILTANHCINTPLKATGSLFLFNYESPYCGSIDGDITNSLSGSKLKATFDSLDFALVELSTPPPATFRPYYAGWSRTTTPADTLASVHHPQGDIKKIAIDYEKPTTATFLSSFIKNAFWKIARWDLGTTEIGSSGGPLFNRSGQLTGTLSGGAAECGDPVNDYFSRFDLAWNYKPDSSRQLKHWLDPGGANPVGLNGKQFNSGEQLCTVFTNLKEGDAHTIVKSTNPSGGYWCGTNADGITEVAEKFVLPGNEKFMGVYLGVGKKFQANAAISSFINIRVYNLKGNSPELLAEKDSVQLKNLVPDAINYIGFKTPVEPTDSFLISIVFQNIRQGDSLVMYQTIRPTGSPNSIWLKKSNSWVRYHDLTAARSSGALVLELLACNVGGSKPDTLYYEQNIPVLLWPNPAVSRFSIQTEYDVKPDSVSVYNLMGQTVRCLITKQYPRHLDFNMNGHPAGIYLISLQAGGRVRTAKVMLVSE